MTLDEVREAWPEFGFAVYAFIPGGAVTLEIHAPGGEILSFTEASEAACFDRLWGKAPEEPEDVFG